MKCLTDFSIQVSPLNNVKFTKLNLSCHYIGLCGMLGASLLAYIYIESQQQKLQTRIYSLEQEHDYLVKKNDYVRLEIEKQLTHSHLIERSVALNMSNPQGATKAYFMQNNQ